MIKSALAEDEKEGNLSFLEKKNLTVLNEKLAGSLEFFLEKFKPI